ncbi:3-deoxy-7-phosphoheptulonate synthase [Haloactinomyces albus]|uniref:Phospho-2-dehydro-3-deoxyheptonate aldolase n=1 Tax=Haloactinomyces albus TaxID=1352928 RepID=A0AAE4CNE7_9ACTN|nr:3-deoxy-7-phosphoheptulonate synthase [Haloactinomyces albus]
MWENLPAEQQPTWRGHPGWSAATTRLAGEQPLVTLSEAEALRARLSRVEAGREQLLQIGDCAENFGECTAPHMAEKLATLDSLSDALRQRTALDVVRVGRFGGQFAKPRSSDTEWHEGVELPVFRGHLVNSETPTAAARHHDPRRMVWAYEASAKTMEWLRQHRHRRDSLVPDGPWSSHEALVMDYESNLVRTDSATGVRYLGSTHLPWIGERTRQPDAAQVRLLAAVANPIGCKIGPSATPADVVRLCEVLDPDRLPGRLTMICRMGRDAVEQTLPPVVDAVNESGHRVVWLVDPMHGNTTKTADGVKTRYLDDISTEALAAKAVLRTHGSHPAGLHLEVAADEVTECVGGPIEGEQDLYRHYTTLCDPRLNPEQAHLLLEQWASC